MGDSWEDDDFEPPPPALAKVAPKSQWDDEDVEDEPAKESWEDEEKAAAPGPGAPKPQAKTSKKKTDKSKTATVSPSTEVEGAGTDSLEEKLRRQRLVEESDFKSTKELFRGKEKEAKSLDDFIPKSDADYAEYFQLIGAKVTAVEKHRLYTEMLKDLLKTATGSLDSSAVKDISSAVTVILNAKLKAEKDMAGGKKKGGVKKTQLKVDKSDLDVDRVGGMDDYGADDYDFM